MAVAGSVADESAKDGKFPDRLAVAEKRREAGNEKFRAGDAKAAGADYDEALKFLRREQWTDCEDEDLVARAKACRIPASLNLALCCLRAEPCEAFRALELCEEVLDAEPENAKAMYRKAKALVELGEFQEADFEFVRACKLSPGDANIRQDLQKLRQKLKDDKKQEKQTFNGLFDRNPGFASDDRAKAAAPAQNASISGGASCSKYDFVCAADENPFESSQHPEREAEENFASGRLEKGIWALEAAVRRGTRDGDWPSHFAAWLALGRVYMDLNADALALRCLNKAAAIGEATDNAAADAGAQPPDTVRQHALLLRAICLLNESESDTLAEVSACLELWLAACGSDASAAGSGSLEERIGRWREGSSSAGADAAVAHGLLHLLNQREEALQAFAEALTAPADESSAFGPPARMATKWNMLGAVLANRHRHEHALQAYAQALAVQPHYPRALTNRGIALRDSGDPAAAVASYTAALQLIPDWASPVIWTMLKQAVQEHPGSDGSLSEAVSQKSLARLRELLGSGLPKQSAEEATTAEALQKIDLAPKPAAP